MSISGNQEIRNTGPKMTTVENNRSSSTGTYALLLTLSRRKTLQVGSLGQFRFNRGVYVYIGSAFGPGGLKARISHHRRVSSKPRWHVDTLRRAATPTGVWYTYDPIRREHQWAQIFLKMSSAIMPANGFGASDCDCPAHLFLFTELPSLATFRCRIYSQIHGHDQIFSYSFNG